MAKNLLIDSTKIQSIFKRVFIWLTALLNFVFLMTILFEIVLRAIDYVI